MQMLQNRKVKMHLMLSGLALLVGCASQRPPANAVNASAAVVNTNQDAQNNQDLSAKTVAPVGFEKFLGIFTPYRITIQQGNFISSEKADEIKLGMTREQVRFSLGTALLTDMFHADRWDYVFRLLKPSGELTTSRVTVFFQNGLVSKIDRGTLPKENEYLKRITDAAIADVIEHSDNNKSPKPKN